MAVEPPPEAAAAPPDPYAGSDIVRNYDPVGAMGGMFAPGYLKGYQPSEQAVAAWNAENHPLTNQMVDELRMPNLNPPAGGGGMANIPYGEQQPKDASFLDPRGSIDTEALRVLAQGGKYNVQGRRDAIAQRLLANQQQAATQAPAAPQSGIPDWYYPQRQYEELTDAHMRGW